MQYKEKSVRSRQARKKADLYRKVLSDFPSSVFLTKSIKIVQLHPEVFENTAVGAHERNADA